MSTTKTGARLGAIALATAGLLFLLFPLLRPWHDETTPAGAVAAFGSAAWVASHLSGALGFILVPLGLLAVFGHIGRGSAGRTMAMGIVICLLGTGLLLPFFGAETFGLNAVARAAAENGSVDVLALSEAIRMGSVAVATFGLGLLAVAVAAVLVALAVARSGLYPQHAALVFAIGYCTYLPQFFGPPWLRTTHGVVLAIGLLLLAMATWRVGDRHRRGRFGAADVEGEPRAAPNRP